MNNRYHDSQSDLCGMTATDTRAHLRSLTQTRDTLMDSFFRSMRLDAPYETLQNLAIQVKRIDRVIAEMAGAA